MDDRTERCEGERYGHTDTIDIDCHVGNRDAESDANPYPVTDDHPDAGANA